MVSWLWSAAMLVVVKIGRQLVLRGGDLVVLGLGEDAELPELLVQLVHERRHARLDGAEIVVVQLLALGRACAPKSVRPV